MTLTVFGAVALGQALDVLDWRIALYAVLSLTVVRMVPVALSLLGMHARPPTVAFLGWFGPRGLASIVFAVILLEGSALPHLNLLITTVAVTVGLSVYAHGLTALPLTEALCPLVSRSRRADRRWRAHRPTSIARGARLRRQPRAS